MTFGKVRLSAGFVLLWSLLYFFDDGGWLVIVAASALVHELGHWAAMRAFGKRIKLLSFTLGGINMTMSHTPHISWKADLFITLAGPLVSLLLAAGAYSYGAWRVAGVSMVLAAVNLLPAAALDGGRALGIIASQIWGSNGERTVNFGGTALCLCVMIAVGAWVAVQSGGRNLTLLAMSVPLLTGVGKTPSQA